MCGYNNVDGDNNDDDHAYCFACAASIRGAIKNNSPKFRIESAHHFLLIRSLCTEHRWHHYQLKIAMVRIECHGCCTLQCLHFPICVNNLNVSDKS